MFKCPPVGLGAWSAGEVKDDFQGANAPFASGCCAWGFANPCRVINITASNLINLHICIYMRTFWPIASVRAFSLAMAADAGGDIKERRKYEFLLLKEILAGMLRDDENFLHRIRNAGAKHPFLQNMPQEGPASAEAIDRFHWCLIPILAQFAADGIPAHAVFKAWCWLIV